MTTSASTPNTAPEIVPVAVGVIRDGNRILLAKRPDHVHQGGRWEFPGGKREPGEDRFAALARELEEELGIRPRGARPLIRIRHDYPDKSVELDVWSVTAYTGEPRGREGQLIHWIDQDELPGLDFPAANRPIVTAARLPSCYLITGAFEDRRDFRTRLERALSRDVKLVQLRAHHLRPDEYLALAREALAVCRDAGARLLVNAAPELAREIGADGVHLTSRQLLRLTARPLPADWLVAASVHNAEQLRHAGRIGVDFSVLSPVAATTSHPQAEPLGWARFSELIEPVSHPVFALGGMQETDLPVAWNAGAQGIAAIGAFWS
ncbi:MAG TPA: Nudix family hydrolase [Gammaproteobacteria bacterium]|nr:Nudix family hydrolase [Gammaproteobacteria bacterium]